VFCTSRRNPIRILYLHYMASRFWLGWHILKQRAKFFLSGMPVSHCIKNDWYMNYLYSSLSTSDFLVRRKHFCIVLRHHNLYRFQDFVWDFLLAHKPSLGISYKFVSLFWFKKAFKLSSIWMWPRHIHLHKYCRLNHRGRRKFWWIRRVYLLNAESKSNRI